MPDLGALMAPRTQADAVAQSIPIVGHLVPVCDVVCVQLLLFAIHSTHATPIPVSFEHALTKLFPQSFQ
jgi:hypothetical protein